MVQDRYYALCTDVTPNRATVARTYATRIEAELARKGVGRRLDQVIVSCGAPLELGERIWIGPQSIDTEILH